MKPRVVYWNNIPAPYMVERFGALVRRDRFEFEAWFSGRTSRGRSWSIEERNWPFRYRYLPSVGQGEYPFALPTPLLMEPVPDLLVTLYAAPSFVLGSSLLRRRGGRLALWVEPTHDAVVRRRQWKDALKRHLFRTADGILTTGEDGRAFAFRYGATPERTFVVPHVVDFDYYARASEVTANERRRIREGFGLRGVTYLYVGRLMRGKGLEHLVDAYARVEATHSEGTSLLVVGDGAEERELRARCTARGVRNVVFAGFRDQAQLPAIYAAADVFVFPTLGDTFGMAVSEAMACGLPVVATTACGEIRDRVSDGVNGFVVPPGDVHSLDERMAMLLRDPGLRRDMGRESRNRMTSQSPEAWAIAFELAIERILELPPATESATGGGS